MPQRPVLLLTMVVLALLAANLGGCATAQGSNPAEKRAYALSMVDQTLSDLYAQRPEAKAKVRAAAGYGVFSNIGTNLIFVSTGGGFGVIRDNETGDDTFMKMGEVGVGLGLGLKDFRAVFIFHDPNVLIDFIDAGWEWGGEADAVAKSGDQGGAVGAAGNVHRGIEVYQFTENGIALSATVSGTRYWPDEELN